MSLIYIFSLIILFNFLDVCKASLLKTDFYESLSIQRQCLIVSHYFPNGPLFLHVDFTFHLYSFIFGYIPKDYNIKNCFRKIETACNNSIFFTTIAKEFRKLKLKIIITLLKYNDFLAEIEYTFFDGITLDNYELFDLFRHFSVYVEIFNKIQKYDISYECSSHDIESYFNSIVMKAENLCIVTRNNNAVILKPDYGISKPDGYITGFQAIFFRNEVYFGERKFIAFNCYKDINYPNEPVILIIDKPKSDINFKVTAFKFSQEILNGEEYEFKIYNTQYIYVDYLGYIPDTYNKVFLVKYTPSILECQDGTTRIEYLSDDGITFYVEEYKSINITSSLESKQTISHSFDDPC